MELLQKMQAYMESRSVRSRIYRWNEEQNLAIQN